MNLRDRLTIALESLGDTPEKIADTLERLGCQGYAGSAEQCPIATYLHEQGFEDVLIFPNSVSDMKFSHLAPLPAAAADFVGRFDRGCYEDLDRNFRGDL